MKAAAPPRWILSFTDLCLVLLGFFVTLYATAADPARVSESFREAFGEQGAADAGRQSLAATALFERDEAVLKPAARAMLERIGRRAGQSRVRLASHGTSGASARLDGWELAAARTGAVARALRDGGVDEARIAIALTPGEGPQTIELAIAPR